ncbi:MAG: SDR family oxidoreductase [Candidatus Obscuribacterales bacterium]|nr:SDR family oxidoreductase [Candidatus Obscuribacterales bacterium]
MKWTVLGAGGFIGSHLVDYLRSQRFDVVSANREFDFSGDENLGHVIYCIGLTADFRNRPLDTVEAHVCVLRSLLQRGNFESLLYLSSTRVYANSQSTGEASSLVVQPQQLSDIYNLSKLLGESMCLTVGGSSVRVARLSNVIGVSRLSTDFLGQITQQAVTEKRVRLETSLQSQKDFLFMDDLMPVLSQIAITGQSRIYNVASGRNTTNAEIVDILVRETGSVISVAPNAPTWSFPPIDITRISQEFGFKSGLFEVRFSNIIAEIQDSLPE